MEDPLLLKGVKEVGLAVVTYLYDFSSARAFEMMSA